MKSSTFSLAAALASAALMLPVAFAQESTLSTAAPTPPASAVAVTSGQIDLHTALSYALENNFDIRQAKERIRQQEGVVVEVRSAAIPNVGASGAYQYNDRAISTSFPASDRAWTVQVTATQLLFAGGGVHAGIRSAELVRDAAALEMKGVVNQALLDVRVQFYNVLLNREKIRVQEENIRLLQQQLKDATARYQAGTASNFEKLRAEVALANAQVPLITARNDYRLSIETFRQVLGVPSSSNALSAPPEPAGTLSYTPATYELQSALEAARNNRPELLRLAKLESAGEENVTNARSGYYPNLSLFGGYELRKGTTNNFGDSVDGFLVGVQSQWKIFDGRATAGRVAQAKSLLSQAKISRSEVALAVDVEVRRAVSSLQEAQELVASSEKVVAQAEESLRLANARYTAGTSTQLDVLTSQVDLTTARTNQLQAYYTYNVALASLRKAMASPDEFVAN